MSNNFDFSLAVKNFNEMYKLTNHEKPTLLGSERLQNFYDIVYEELTEGQDIALKYRNLSSGFALTDEQKLDLLTDMSDWLGDLVVYLTSESMRWGVSVKEALRALDVQLGEPLNALGLNRINIFFDFMKDEMQEGLSIASFYKQASTDVEISQTDKDEICIRLSKWLSDLIVFCVLESRPWGIELKSVLKIIMDSNASKLGADGKPIYDERGKVMKGPGYWKPEPKIKEMHSKTLSTDSFTVRPKSI